MKCPYLFLIGVVLTEALCSCGGRTGKSSGQALCKPAPLPTLVAAKGKGHVRVVLQVDGGGILGITPAILLARLEEAVNAKAHQPGRRLGERLDLCSGTSTGAIITSMLACGVPATTIRDFYLSEERGGGVWLFRTQQRPFNFGGLVRHKYKRDEFQKSLRVALKEHSWYGQGEVTFGQMKMFPVLVIPAFEMRSRNSMFFRSREADGDIKPAVKDLPVAQVVDWSALTAASYFGDISKGKAKELEWDHVDAEGRICSEKGAVFMDGGQGTQNNTLFALLLEIADRRWADDDLIIISLGTGNDTRVRARNNVAHLSVWGEILDYSFVGDNQARHESIQLQVLALRRLASSRGNVHFYRLDYEDSSGRKMDNARPEDIQAYIAKADKISDTMQFQQLVNELGSQAGRSRAPLVPVQHHRPSALQPLSY